MRDVLALLVYLASLASSVFLGWVVARRLVRETPGAGYLGKAGKVAERLAVFGVAAFVLQAAFAHLAVAALVELGLDI
jgi:hypothetical protein